jgi:hypothetical protein
LVISLIKIFDSVSRDLGVGVIGVEGGEVSDSEEFVGDRPGTAPSVASLGSAVELNIGKEGIGARSLRSGYKCRDFSKEFSDLKYRIADRRFSTCPLALPSPVSLYVPAQQVATPPNPHPSEVLAQQQEVMLP